MQVPFVDLAAQYSQIKKLALSRIDNLCKKGNFILGQEVGKFEQEFANYCQVKYAVGLNSGTDALFLSLLSLGVGRNDEVIIPAFTFIATAFAVSHTGAKPVFVDINENTYNINVDKIKRAITRRTRAIIPVHLFGQTADMNPILNIADKYGLRVIEDAAQAHGAEYFSPQSTVHSPQSKKAGSMGDIGCFSFYPTKNLGAFGDAGIIVTNNKRTFKRLRMLRDCGRSSHNLHELKGYNSRLDTLQAVILRLKLGYLDKWNQIRRANAKIYTDLLKSNEHIVCPFQAPYARHVYHIYSLQVRQRDRIYAYLRKRGIATLIHYSLPIHRQKAYKDLGYKWGDFPTAEGITRRIISLPMHPFLKCSQIEYVAAEILRILD